MPLGNFSHGKKIILGWRKYYKWIKNCSNTFHHARRFFPHLIFTVETHHYHMRWDALWGSGCFLLHLCCCLYCIHCIHIAMYCQFFPFWATRPIFGPSFKCLLKPLAEIGRSAPISARSGSLLSKAAKDKAMAANSSSRQMSGRQMSSREYPAGKWQTGKWLSAEKKRWCNHTTFSSISVSGRKN